MAIFVNASWVIHGTSFIVAGMCSSCRWFARERVVMHRALAMRPDNPNNVAYHWKALFRCSFNSVNRTINDPGVKLEFYDYDEIKASKLIVSTTGI